MKIKSLLMGLIAVGVLSMPSFTFAAEPEAEAAEAVQDTYASSYDDSLENEMAVKNGVVADGQIPVYSESLPVVKDKKICINTASCSLSVIVGETRTNLYPVALGRLSTPTPVGYYKVDEKVTNPIWVDPDDSKKVIESGSENPLGYRWMSFHGNYGIHGTNNESSIGNYVSNGCIRMRERDVEELYEMIPIGTPVEITYNRVVVEKAADDTIVYYIYPDSYNMQPITVEMVNDWLKGFGVNTFENDESIAEKIRLSDGQPTFIAKAYPILINGQRISGGIAVEYDDMVYLPVIAMAEAMDISLGYKASEGVVFSKFARVPGFIFKNIMYINADDAETLFNIEGGFANKTYQFSRAVSE